MFVFRLALHLGMTVRELGERMDSRELSEWLAYDRIEPMPDPWAQTGIQCATMANLWSKGRHKPEDFMPRPAMRRHVTPEENEARMRAFAARMKAQ